MLVHQRVMMGKSCLNDVMCWFLFKVFLTHHLELLGILNVVNLIVAGSLVPSWWLLKRLYDVFLVISVLPYLAHLCFWRFWDVCESCIIYIYIHTYDLLYPDIVYIIYNIEPIYCKKNIVITSGYFKIAMEIFPFIDFVWWFTYIKHGDSPELR